MALYTTHELNILSLISHYAIPPRLVFLRKRYIFEWLIKNDKNKVCSATTEACKTLKTLSLLRQLADDLFSR